MSALPDLPALAQAGAAGLIGWMWLAERRAAAARERQLSELHDRLMQQRISLSALVSVIRDNTRALTALEVGQRTLSSILDRLTRRAAPTPPSGGSGVQPTHGSPCSTEPRP